MRRLILIGALAVCAAASPALAESWTKVSSDAHFTLAFDKDSIALAAGHAKFWDKLTLATPQKGRDFSGQFAEVRFQRDMDCAGRKVTTLAERFFDEKGALVHATDTAGTPSPISAGSPAELELKQVCG